MDAVAVDSKNHTMSRVYTKMTTGILYDHPRIPRFAFSMKPF